MVEYSKKLTNLSLPQRNALGAMVTAYAWMATGPSAADRGLIDMREGEPLAFTIREAKFLTWKLVNKLCTTGDEAILRLAARLPGVTADLSAQERRSLGAALKQLGEIAGPKAHAVSFEIRKLIDADPTYKLDAQMATSKGSKGNA